MHHNIIYIIFILLLSCDNDNSHNYTCNDIDSSSELINFLLEDKNPNSSTYGISIGPDFFPNTVRLFYFSNNPN